MTPGHSYSLAGRAPSCLTVDAGAGAEAGDGEEDKGRPNAGLLSAGVGPGSCGAGDEE